ncbi:IS110 family transposase [Clostridium baratii]|uniref:IS110 family transposase n=1 Tax=Clostridium baratii TaxID=1561 RepID=UPI0030CE49FD
MKNLYKLYIGIDIGRKKNVVAFANEWGEEVRKKLKLKNTYYSMYDFKEAIDILVHDMKLKSYEEILVGVESTGHYWINLETLLKRMGLKVVMVQGTVVKNMRNLIASQKGKNAPIDSKAIAFCIKDGYYSEITPKSKDMNSLKNMCRLRNELVKSSTAVKNKIHAWLDVNNQFFLNVFNFTLQSTGLKILEKYPLADDMLNLSDVEFINEIMKDNPKLNRRKALLYKEEVTTWKDYIIETTQATKHEIKSYVRSYIDLEKQISELDEEIERATKEIYGKAYESLCNVKGMPNITLSSLLAEIGDFSLFKNARVIQSFIGLGISAEQSGEHLGESGITRRGNRRSRQALYIITRQLIIHNPEVKKLYCYYLSLERRNENKKIEMWIATMCKLLRGIYGTIKNNSEFSYEVLFEKIDFSKCNMEKFNNLYNKKDVEKMIDENNERDKENKEKRNNRAKQKNKRR